MVETALLSRSSSTTSPAFRLADLRSVELKKCLQSAVSPRSQNVVFSRIIYILWLGSTKRTKATKVTIRRRVALYGLSTPYTLITSTPTSPSC